MIEELRQYPSPSIASAAPMNNTNDDEEMTIETTPLLVSNKANTESNNNKSQWLIHLAINISFIANVVLFLTKVFLAIYSGSMAILASAFESFLDILSNAIIFFTIRIIRQRNVYDYPVGKVSGNSVVRGNVCKD